MGYEKKGRAVLSRETTMLFRPCPGCGSNRHGYIKIAFERHAVWRGCACCKREWCSVPRYCRFVG